MSSTIFHKRSCKETFAFSNAFKNSWKSDKYTIIEITFPQINVPEAILWCWPNWVVNLHSFVFLAVLNFKENCFKDVIKHQSEEEKSVVQS